LAESGILEEADISKLFEFSAPMNMAGRLKTAPEWRWRCFKPAMEGKGIDCLTEERARAKEK